MKLIIFVIAFIACSNASRVLFLFPTPSKSHVIIVHSVSKTLAARGHEVTVVSPFPLDKKVKNHREIKSPFPKEVEEFFDEFKKDGKTSMLTFALTSTQKMIKMTNDMIEMKEFQALLDEKFDLIVIGIVANNYLLGYGDHFKCPTVVLSVQKHYPFTDIFVGNPLEVNAVPNGFLTFDEWNFKARVKNFLISGFFHILEMYGNYVQGKEYE